MNRDIITIGGSAGAIPVLLDAVAELPADLAASVFVVVHQYPFSPSVLPELLSNRGPLPARHPLHAEAILPGHIYVAPPDTHLTVKQGIIEVMRGAKENGHRPSVDALFRTASIAYGPRVIGVVLSGYQDCGTAGMLSIKARGGVSVVQAPDTAQAADMPSSVLESVPVDHVVKPSELAALLARLTAADARGTPNVDAQVQQIEGARSAKAAEIVCPLCHGVLQEAQAGVFVHFRCHVGHTFSLDNLVREQAEEVERALWAAVRALEESSAINRRIGRDRGEVGARFDEKARVLSSHAEYVRQLLLHGAMLSRTDALDEPDEAPVDELPRASGDG
jgi:two-component system, chemotaxis family, protein-glutamate methylesterase/glutaminase